MENLNPCFYLGRVSGGYLGVDVVDRAVEEDGQGGAEGRGPSTRQPGSNDLDLSSWLGD